MSEEATQTSESAGTAAEAVTETGAATEAGHEPKASEANGADTAATQGAAAGDSTQKAEEAKAPEFVYSDWAKTLKDEKMRDYALRFKSVDDILQGSMKNREELSTRIKLPGKDAKPEEIATFKKQIGAPESPDKYEISAPEGYSLEGPVGIVTDMAKDLAFKHHIPASAYKEFSEGLIKIDQEMQEKVNEAVQQWRSEKEKEIRKEFGADFEASLNAGKRARDTFGDDDLVGFLDTPVTINGVSMTPGDHPAMIRFMATLGKRMGEDGVIGMTTDGERQSTKERIDEIYAKTPPGTAGYAAPAVQKELRSLFEKLEGDGAIVGAGGRTR